MDSDSDNVASAPSPSNFCTAAVLLAITTSRVSFDVELMRIGVAEEKLSSFDPRGLGRFVASSNFITACYGTATKESAADLLGYWGF